MKKQFLLTLFIFSVFSLTAQVKIGGDPNVIDSSAILELESTTQGVLIPRMTTSQRTAISSPAIGLQVYDTDTKTFWYFNGTIWVNTISTNSVSKWTNDPSGQKVFLTNLSDGTTSRTGTNQITIEDDGGVGIGTAAPNTNAILEINSTDKGVLIPRIALTSALSPSPLTSFVDGMLVYNTASAGTAPNNVTPGLYVAQSLPPTWVKYNLVQGNRGDLTITGESHAPLYAINNNAITSNKIATSLKVGGGFPTNSSVAFEVAGGNRGMVVSTTSNLSSILNPIAGMIVYSTTEGCLRFFNGSRWSNCLAPTPGDVSTGGTGISSAYNCGTAISTTPTFGRRASGLNKTITATVTTIGSYNITATSPTLPSLVFNATGNFLATGSQNITLVALGDLNVTGTHTFTINTTPNCTFNLTVNSPNYTVSTGSTFNGFYNGVVNGIYAFNNNTQNASVLSTMTHPSGESFDQNSGCSSKTISVTNPTNCPATVTGTSGQVYPLVWINGQCWFARNLYEVPTTGCTDAPNTGCNTWTTTSVGDYGYWGYWDPAPGTPNGANGWAITESAANRGLLYQWSAAMNGATTERARGICPTGYHIPSDCEFQFLEFGLGMPVAEVNIFATRDGNGTTGSRVSKKLMRAQSPHVTQTGFNANNTGSRWFTGAHNFGNSVFLHTSTLSSSSLSVARWGNISSNDYGLIRNELQRGIAIPVRCLKDN